MYSHPLAHRSGGPAGRSARRLFEYTVFRISCEVGGGALVVVAVLASNCESDEERAKKCEAEGHSEEWCNGLRKGHKGALRF